MITSDAPAKAPARVPMALSARLVDKLGRTAQRAGITASYQEHADEVIIELREGMAVDESYALFDLARPTAGERELIDGVENRYRDGFGTNAFRAYQQRRGAAVKLLVERLA